MAKQQSDAPAPAPAVEATKPDVNPEVAFKAAWRANKDGMRAILTETGRPRGNLKPSEIKRAIAIRESYGL